MKKASQLTRVEIADLIHELRHISDPSVFKTDEQHEADCARKREICKMFDARYVDDVFDRYGKYAQNV